MASVPTRALSVEYMLLSGRKHIVKWPAEKGCHSSGSVFPSKLPQSICHGFNDPINERLLKVCRGPDTEVDLSEITMLLEGQPMSKTGEDSFVADTLGLTLSQN